MSHKLPADIKLKIRRKITQTPCTTRYDVVTTLHKKDRLRRRPPAALRGFRIEVTIQNLFTTISSKTCFEPVVTVPSAVWSNQFFFENPAFERKSVLSLVLPWIKKPTNPMISSICRFLQQTKKKPKKN